MIDIHCHILPGLDDGAKDIETAFAMAKIAVKDGITKIVATPHCYDGYYNCQNKDILGCCAELNALLTEKNIPLKIFPGGEVRAVPELEALAKERALPVINVTNQMVLLELPEIFILDAMVTLLFFLKKHGYNPIIAHPERNMTLQRNPDMLHIFAQAGVQFQLTAGSLLGGFGKAAKNMARHIIVSGMSFCLATDAHDAKQRKPLLSKAFFQAKKLEKKHVNSPFILKG